jgi:hypothetical protein
MDEYGALLKLYLQRETEVILENLSQRHSLHHVPEMDRPGIVLRTALWVTGG